MGNSPDSLKKYPAFEAFKQRVDEETKHGFRNDTVYIDGNYQFTRMGLITEFQSALNEIERVQTLEGKCRKIIKQLLREQGLSYAQAYTKCNKLIKAEYKASPRKALSANQGER